MEKSPDVDEVASTLRVAIGLLFRRLRQVQVSDAVTLPESSALVRLDREGPATSSALAKLEQISPQSMGATIAGLESRGLVERRADPDDGRRVVLSLTDAGRQVLHHRRSEKLSALTQALSDGFSSDDLRILRDSAALLERLAGKL